METSAVTPSAPPRDLPVVGGHLALDFANTVDDPNGLTRWDHVSTYDDLLAWTRRAAGLDGALLAALTENAAQHPRKAAAAHRRALDARSTLTAVFGAIAAGEEPAQTDWTALRSRAADGLSRAELAPSDASYALRWSDPSDLDLILHRIVDEAVQLIRSPDLGRVKRCAGCPWLFIDRSKNGSRRWCAMNDCGTHEKIQRYVSRRAARRTH